MGTAANVLRRPEGSADAVLVLVLQTACQIADTGRSDRELVDVEEQWSQAGVDLSRDAWIALDASGDAIGYAFVHGGRAVVDVHPRGRTRGLGAELRELVEARALEQRAPELEQTVAGGNRPAERLLELAGYRPVHHTWRFERPLDVLPPPASWPTGITAREPRGDEDLAGVLALLDRSHVTTPDGHPLALDRFHAEHLAPELLDPDLCVVAFRGQRLVGAAIAETWDESDGSIVALIVDHDERGHGVGHALLLAVLGRLRDRGLHTAVLHDGGREAVVPSLYEDVGMRAVWRQTSWLKRLR
jgi:GNAT superfamily N-acetyltransferase